MDKNIIFAFLISTVVIILYYLVFPPAPKSPSPQPTATTTQSVDPSPQQVSKPVSKPQQIITAKGNGRIIVLESDLFEAKINTQGAVLESFILKNYNHSSKPRIDLVKTVWNTILGRKNPNRVYEPGKKVQMINPAHLQTDKIPWDFSLQEGESLLFTTEAESGKIQGQEKVLLVAQTEQGVVVEKTFLFDAKNYLVKTNISVFNSSTARIPVEPSFIIGSGGELNETDYQAKPPRFAIYYDKDLDIYDGGDLQKNNAWQNFDWIGMMDVYFIQALKTTSENWEVSLKASNQFFRESPVIVPFLELLSSKRVLDAGEKWQTDFEIFIGPKEKNQMTLFSNTLEQSLDLNFDFIGQPMLIALRWFYNFIPNWGVAIIFLTILVRLIIFPLTYKGMKSMKRMSAMGPKIQALKAKHGNNKEKLNKEMMEIYKKQKINPLGGCLPLLLQIPIFIALYSALIPAIELRHSKFIFWITDLSQSDFIYVLPVLMGVSMYLQQKLAPVAANMDPTQQKIFKWLPVLMTFFFLSFPAGLVLYWLTSNIISIGQQQIINRIKIEEPASNSRQTVQERKKSLQKNIKNMYKKKK
jgi:YidC/Oxa1 family membrane protein insertase